MLRSTSGEVIGTASIGEDITIRKRMEEELKQSEQRFRMVVESFSGRDFCPSVNGHYVDPNSVAVASRRHVRRPNDWQAHQGTYPPSMIHSSRRED